MRDFKNGRFIKIGEFWMALAIIEYLNGLMLTGIALTCVGVTLVQVYKPAEERQADPG